MNDQQPETDERCACGRACIDQGCPGCGAPPCCDHQPGCGVRSKTELDYIEPEYVDCTCGHPHDDHEDGECPFSGCGCGAFYDEDDCQHEWELRSEHDLWVCAWCSAEVTSPPGAPS